MKIFFNEIDCLSQAIFSPDGCRWCAAIFRYQIVFRGLNGLEQRRLGWPLKMVMGLLS